MAKRHLTFDCPVCHAEDEVVARALAASLERAPSDAAEAGRWICFNCDARGSWVLLLSPDEPGPAV